MNALRDSLIVTAATVLSCSAAPLVWAEDISDARDLTAVLALDGRPCGNVVSAAKRGENDYVATCTDGNRYRVFVRDGRVVVERLD